MATRNKPRIRVKDPTPPAPDPPTEAEQMPPTIRKGIYLSALIYIEGDQPAPEDFTAWATSALKKTLASGFEGEHEGLSMTVKKVEVRNDVEEDSLPEGEEKFQF